LQAYCDEFVGLTGIRLSFRAEGSFDDIPASVALGLYRITQEALQNVAKHAKAADAEVSLRYSEGLLCLTIADRGLGMELRSAHAPAGLGLISIKERARLLHGTVEILSKATQGTTITVRLDVGALHHAAKA
jgi:signal transduction histidine kinase